MRTRPSLGSAGHISIATLRISGRSTARNMRPSAAAGPRLHARLQTAEAQAAQNRRPARSRPRARSQRTKAQAAQNPPPARSPPRKNARKPNARSRRSRRRPGWSCIRAYNSRAWRRAYTPVFNGPSAARHLANSGAPRAACSNKSSMRSLIGLFCMPSAPVAEPRR